MYPLSVLVSVRCSIGRELLAWRLPERRSGGRTESLRKHVVGAACDRRKLREGARRWPVYKQGKDHSGVQTCSRSHGNTPKSKDKLFHLVALLDQIRPLEVLLCPAIPVAHAG